MVGSATLAGVVVRDLRSGEARPLEATALFVLIGSTPQTTWLHGQIPLDDKGFVRTGSAGQAGAGRYETDRPGVFAVGDVRSGSEKRVASAVGEGAIAVRQVHDSSVLPDDADKRYSPHPWVLTPILPVRVSGGPN